MPALPRILVVAPVSENASQLRQRLNGRFEIREEADGESAWQTLVLDKSIVAVVTGFAVDRLSGPELVDRLRTSRLRRLQVMPCVLVEAAARNDQPQVAPDVGNCVAVSEVEGVEGVLRQLASWLDLSGGSHPSGAAHGDESRDPSSDLFTCEHLLRQAELGVSRAAPKGEEVSFIVLGFDALPELQERLGPEATAQVAIRFARMLAGKMRQQDLFGHYKEGAFAIVSPGTSPALCISFARRVREAVELARVSVQGQALALTVSIGVASLSAEAGLPAADLLSLAADRMLEAMQSGGNCIVASGDEKHVGRALTVQHALELLAVNRLDLVKPYLGDLAVSILPLLRLMDEALELNLPMAVLEARMRDQAQQKSA